MQKCGLNAAQVFLAVSFSIPSPMAYLVLTCFVNNVVSQVDILLIGVRIEICSSDISQLPSVTKKKVSIGAYTFKIDPFDHILTLGKNLRCDFAVGIREIHRMTLMVFLMELVLQF